MRWLVLIALFVDGSFAQIRLGELQKVLDCIYEHEGSKNVVEACGIKEKLFAHFKLGYSMKIKSATEAFAGTAACFKAGNITGETCDAKSVEKICKTTEPCDKQLFSIMFAPACKWIKLPEEFHDPSRFFEDMPLEPLCPGLQGPKAKPSSKGKDDPKKANAISGKGY